MNFPTLHCKCPNEHEWASLIPKQYVAIKDLECPHCNQPACQIKAGDWRTLEEVKKAYGSSQDSGDTKQDKKSIMSGGEY